MAHVLRITDGAGTVNFNSGNNSLLSFVPRSPNQSTVDFTPEALRDGGERIQTTRRNVTESAEVLFGGTDSADMRSALGSVTKYLRQAERYQRYQAGSPVYIEFQPGGSGDVYRSEVLGGKVELSDLTLSASQWNKNKARGLLAYTRRHYWEGPESELVIYNGGGSGTAGVTVYNHNDSDSDHDNYVEIAGTSVGGNIHTPIRLEVTNKVADTMKFLRVGHDYGGSVTSMVLVYEGETGTGGGTAAAATCSNGGYRGSTADLTTETTLITWNITAADVLKYAGRYFNVLARLYGTVNAVKFRLKLDTAGVTLWQSPQITLTSTVSDGAFLNLGVTQIPPGITNLPNPANISMLLTGQRAGTTTINVDYVQLLPLSSYRSYTAQRDLGNGHKLIDDGITGNLYADFTVEATPGQMPSMSAVGGAALMLEPGEDQRLYFHWLNNSTAQVIGSTASVRAYYRPRKETL